MPYNGLIGGVFNGKSGSGSMADGPNHSDRVLLEFFIGIPDGSDDLPLKVSHPMDIVDDGEIRNIVKEAIDGDVPAKGIFLGCSKAICSDDLPIFDRFFEFRMATKSGDFDDLSLSKKDLNQLESTADNTAVLEEEIDFVRASVGGDIEVFGDLPQKKIANASSYKVC
jgi:hypothetical protein